jgi:hypothetical protein
MSSLDTAVIIDGNAIENLFTAEKRGRYPFEKRGRYPLFINLRERSGIHCTLCVSRVAKGPHQSLRDSFSRGEA